MYGAVLPFLAYPYISKACGIKSLDIPVYVGGSYPGQDNAVHTAVWLIKGDKSGVQQVLKTLYGAIDIGKSAQLQAVSIAGIRIWHAGHNIYGTSWLWRGGGNKIMSGRGREYRPSRRLRRRGRNCGRGRSGYHRRGRWRRQFRRGRRGDRLGFRYLGRRYCLRNIGIWLGGHRRNIGKIESYLAILIQSQFLPGGGRKVYYTR
jgi:hypothetical protein